MNFEVVATHFFIRELKWLSLNTMFFARLPDVLSFMIKAGEGGNFLLLT